MESYPIMLDLRGKEAVVVGGGKVAYRKMTSLIKAGANVTVISPNLYERVEQLLAVDQITWHEKSFEEDDLATAMIVIAATNNKKVNEQVVQCSAHHQLVNVVDNQELSNFHVPAKLSRGKLTIAVATGGASPLLAKNIRDELAVIYDESYGNYLEFLADAREKIHETKLDSAAKSNLLHEVTDVSRYKSLEKQRAFFEKMNGSSRAY